MPSRPVYRVTAVNFRCRRLHVSAADCKGMALSSRREHIERVAENDVIMARHTLTYDEQLHTLMAGARRLNNKFATCWALLYTCRHVAFDRAFNQLTDQFMTMLEDTEACSHDEDCPVREGTYNNFAQQMRDDRDDVILELGAWKAE